MKTRAMICKDCAIYEPDQVNPPGGLGDCEINRRNPRQVAIQCNDQLHYHSNLIYPNATGCSQWRASEGK